VIRSFRDKDAAALFDRHPVRKLPPGIQRVALRKLRQLDAAVALEELRVPPGNRLEKLIRIAPGNIASASMSSGESAFDGRPAMRTM
jgi:plasmid maintenance system killer protein